MGSLDISPAAAHRGSFSPKAEKRLIVGCAAAFAVIVLAIIAGFGIAAYRTMEFSPEAKVTEYLEAIEDGRFGDAAALAPPDIADGNQILLTNEVGAATTERLTSFEIRSVSVDGDRATVEAEMEMNGSRTWEVFELTRSGTAFFVFPVWELVPPKYSVVFMNAEAEVDSLDVNGVEVDASAATAPQDGPYATNPDVGLIPLPAFPGTYPITPLYSSEYVEADAMTLRMEPGGSTDQEGDWTPRLSAAGEARVNELVAEQIDACYAGQTEPRLSDEGLCRRIQAPISDKADGIPGRWQVDAYPQMEALKMSEGWQIYPGDAQKGQATYTYTGAGGAGEKTYTRTMVGMFGNLTVNDDGDVEIDWDEY
ncbi:MAG: hypothetical protein Q4G21_09890 [Dermabacter sp.]|nr:hypothetical protein [Dermabacter sp.]